MRFKKSYWIGIAIGAFILLVDFAVYYRTPFFIPLIIVAITVTWTQYWVDFFLENQRSKLYEAKFLEFVRNMTSAVKSGMPISRAIVHVSRNDYGPFSRFVRKLANQIEWAIPLHRSMVNFGNATRNNVIKRAISTVIEAERSGGNMEDVLESITQSLVEIKKIKLTRKANIQSQIIQSYIIFFVFIGVMVVIQNMLIPYLGGLEQGVSDASIVSGFNLEEKVNINFSSLSSFILSVIDWFGSLKGILLMLSLVQGFFAGLVLGKLSEGDLSSGLKHSLILMTTAFFVMSLSQGFGG
ncbi:MAG: type II secretion system F family protein [Nanoarchaeota archaeon]|nr:type II secretion system F family protein [Nanoarchaeota archaeon]